MNCRLAVFNGIAIILCQLDTFAVGVFDCKILKPGRSIGILGDFINSLIGRDMMIFYEKFCFRLIGCIVSGFLIALDNNLVVDPRCKG